MLSPLHKSFFVSQEFSCKKIRMKSHQVGLGSSKKKVYIIIIIKGFRTIFLSNSKAISISQIAIWVFICAGCSIVHFRGSKGNKFSVPTGAGLVLEGPLPFRISTGFKTKLIFTYELQRINFD